jgi:hypothetical protein
MPGPSPNAWYMVDCKEIEDSLRFTKPSLIFGALEGAIISHEDDDVVKELSERRARDGISRRGRV